MELNQELEELRQTKLKARNDKLALLIKNLQDASKNKLISVNDFIKTLLIMMSTVLSVLISLYPKSIATVNEKLTFLLTIFLFTISILFGGLGLYAYTDLLKKIEGYYKDKISNINEQNRQNESSSIDVLNANKFYTLCIKIFYCTSILSLFTLLSYSIIKVNR